MEQSLKETLVELTWFLISKMETENCQNAGDSVDIRNEIIDTAEVFEDEFARKVNDEGLDPTDYLEEIRKQANSLFYELLTQKLIERVPEEIKGPVFIECPACKEHISDKNWSEVDKGDGTWNYVNCHNCGITYRVEPDLRFRITIPS